MDTFDWEAYYQKVSGRAARPLLREVIDRTGVSTQPKTRQAIDLGCGDGTETVILLEHGWRVLALDGEPAAITQLRAKVPAEAATRLETRVIRFEDIGVLPSADLLHASLSLPFCHPQHFDALWTTVVNSIASGGWFAGNFFGVNDSWTVHDDMTFHTEEQVRMMLEMFEIEYFHEEDADGRSTLGPKHWHIFSAVARKR